MLRIGEYNKMKVDREKDFGFYLRELGEELKYYFQNITRRK